MALNPMYSLVPDDPDLVQFADKILDQVHMRAVPILRAELQRRDIVLTQKLLLGLSRSVNRKYQERVVEFVLEMDMHGQFQDYRTQKYTGKPPFEPFYQGILKALEMGKITPYNIPNYAQKSREATAAYIASVTVVKVSKTAQITRPSSRSHWFKAYFQQIIGPMNDQLQIAAAAVALKESEHIIKKTLNDRTVK